jgi:hypothetical protein
MTTKKTRSQLEFHERVGTVVLPRNAIVTDQKRSLSGVILLTASAAVVILAVMWAVRIAGNTGVEAPSTPAGVIPLQGSLDDTRRGEAAKLAVSNNQDYLLQTRPSINQFQQMDQEPIQQASPTSQYQATSPGYVLQGSVGTAALR